MLIWYSLITFATEAQSLQSPSSSIVLKVKGAGYKNYPSNFYHCQIIGSVSSARIVSEQESEYGIEQKEA